MVREGIEERERERIDSTKKGGEREDERERRESEEKDESETINM